LTCATSAFFLTTQQFLDGSKTVTRRLGWRNLEVGQRLRACKKCMGLKKGQNVKPLGVIEVVDVRRELLSDLYYKPQYGQRECRLEGFPEMTPIEFIGMFKSHMGCDIDDEVTRIEFIRVS